MNENSNGENSPKGKIHQPPMENGTSISDISGSTSLSSSPSSFYSSTPNSSSSDNDVEQRHDSTNSQSSSRSGQYSSSPRKSGGSCSGCDICRRRSSFSSTSSRSSTNSNRVSSYSYSEYCDDSFIDESYVPDEKTEETSEDESEVPVSTIESSTLSVTGMQFSPVGNSTLQTHSSTASQPSNDIPILVSPPRKGYKRKQNPEQWKKNVSKRLRNSGAAYETHTENKQIREKRQMKGPCGVKCRLKCSSKFTFEEREKIFLAYWALGDIEKQRQFIHECMVVIEPKYRYVRVDSNRKQRGYNNGFYFYSNAQKIRVCKFFFVSTLGITDRAIRTVQEKRNKVADTLIEPDQRGKHGKHKMLDPEIREGIKKHIESIPKIESHYTRANTTRTFVDGSRSLADIHRDYVDQCNKSLKPYGSYAIFQRIFREEFNISFFVPKKDMCESCDSFNNAIDSEKEKMRENHEKHLAEKQLAREEKKKDKNDPTLNGILAAYDLQAVMQIPKGDVSVFYYKSKLNVFNFTIYDLKTNGCECYVWDEARDVTSDYRARGKLVFDAHIHPSKVVEL